MNEKRLVLAQDNALTKGKYAFDKIEKRCLYQIIYTVRKNYIETNKGNRDLWNNLCVSLTPAQLDECIGGRDNRSKVYASLKKLTKKDLSVDNDNEWFTCNFINYAKHDKKADLYEVEVSKLILPYLVALAENFTTLDLTVALTFTSQYTQRFYEFCCMYRNQNTNYFFLDLEELRSMLGLENKYERFYNFKIKILDKAQAEMKQSYDNEISDIYFTWKKNEKINNRIDFYLHQKKDDLQINYNAVTMAINSIHNTLTLFFPRDKKYIKRVIKELQLNPEKAIQAKEKIDKKVNDYPRKDIPPILRYVLKEDFNIE